MTEQLSLTHSLPLRLTGLISLLSKGLSGVFSSTTVQSSILQCSAFFMVRFSQPHVPAGKTTAFVGRVMPLLFNTLSRFIIAFRSRSNHLLISQLQSPPIVVSEPKKRKSVTTSTFPPSICQALMGADAVIFVFLICNFKPALSLSSFTVIKRLFSSSLLSAIRVVSSAFLRLLVLLLPILVSAGNSPNPGISHDAQHID